jgi:hypothetical protein
MKRILLTLSSCNNETTTLFDISSSLFLLLALFLFEVWSIKILMIYARDGNIMLVEINCFSVSGYHVLVSLTRSLKSSNKSTNKEDMILVFGLLFVMLPLRVVTLLQRCKSDIYRGDTSTSPMMMMMKEGERERGR